MLLQFAVNFLIIWSPSLCQNYYTDDYNKYSCPEATPSCPYDSKYIGYYLYTSQDKDPTIISSEKIEDAPFISEAPVKFLIHGFDSDKDKIPNKQIRPAYLKTGNYNIITVDWSYYSHKPCYYEATKSLITVGNCTAFMIEAICTKRPDLNCTGIHLIGHSLGAQTAGRAGKYSKQYFNRTLTRVTALDPAHPEYDKYFFSGFSINKTDAKQVDVTHTNSGMVGKPDACGTVDYFMNGGTWQPGCHYYDNTCNHCRAADYYAESVFKLGNGFYGYPCSVQKYDFKMCYKAGYSDYIKYGVDIPTNVTGIYFVDTNDRSPFSRGMVQDGIPPGS